MLQLVNCPYPFTYSQPQKGTIPGVEYANVRVVKLGSLRKPRRRRRRRRERHQTKGLMSWAGLFESWSMLTQG